MIRNILFLFLFATNLLAINKISFDDTDKEIIKCTYDFKFDRAEYLLDSKLKEHPDSLKYYFLMLGLKSMQLEKSVYDEKPVTKRELKTRILEETIEYADGIIEKFEDIEETTENKFYLGCIYGYLGRMHGVMRSWMSAFSDGKTGRNLLEEVIEEEPDFHDAYLLLGMFNYYADRMGGFLGFVAGILGFSGDRDTGIEYILKTYNNGSLLSDQAELLLIELYSSLEGNGFAAIPVQRNFIKRYPDNYHVKNWYVRDLLKYNMIHEAEDFIRKDIVDHVDPYYKAQVYQKLGNYELSNSCLDKAEKKIDFYYDGWKEHIVFLRAINYWILCDAKYEKYSEKLNERLKKIFETFAKNEKLGREIISLGEETAKDQLSKRSIELIENPPEIKDKLLDVILAYNTGVYYYQNGSYDEARKSFERVKFFDKEYFHFNAVQYLIDIFGRMEVHSVKVEELISEIEEHEYENLSYWAKDLAKKYDLD